VKRTPLTQIARVVDAAVAGRIDLDDINAAEPLRPDLRHERHSPQGTARGPFSQLRALARIRADGGLAASSRPGEQVRVIDPIVGQRPLQWLCDMVLTDDFREGVWAVRR
jgi:hypothetical protein